MQNHATARWAVFAMFFANGALNANWVSRIPYFKSHFNLSDGELGFVLLATAAGVLSALAITSGLIARYGSRRMTIYMGIGICLSLLLLALMPHPLALWGGLFIFGGFVSAMDVAMNAQGVEVEKRYQRPVLSSFHAGWSLGGFFGAGTGALMAYLEVSPLPHFLGVSVLFLGVIVYMASGLVDVDGEQVEQSSIFQLPARPLWLLGALALCAAIGEGSIADWGGVYLKDVVGTSEDVAALGYTAFSFTMMLGRFSGDALRGRFTPAQISRIGGSAAAIGLLGAALFPEIPIVIVGFAAVGVGLANVIPLAFSEAGKMPGVSASSGIAGVASIGYAGFLAGPPILGLVSEALSLRASLALVALMCAAIFVLSKAFKSTIEQPEA